MGRLVSATPVTQEVRKPWSGLFLPGQDASASAFDSGLRGLSLQDTHEIRLLLRGDSVVDWYRLGLTSIDDVRRLLALNGLNINDPTDAKRLETLRGEAAAYTTETLGLRLDDDVSTRVPTTELFLLASGSGKHQRMACTLLKVMHIIYHLDARELRLALPVPDSEVFSRVEQSITHLFDELRTSGVPVVEFAWSRKAKDSLVTKLLVKRQTNAARIFDRLRFRLVVEHEQDILPTLHLMLRRFIPFNYVVPGQTVNSLVSSEAIDARVANEGEFSISRLDGADEPPNEFSSRGYQVLNFVADLPVRVDGLMDPSEFPSPVVFVLAEFQIVDRERAIRNEEGENSHQQYKTRQHHRVRERLLREPRKSSGRS